MRIISVAGSRCNREHVPFALTVGAEPHWSREDEISGEPVDNYGSEFSIAADKEFIKGGLFGALNLVYGPEVTRSRIAVLWQREAMLGVLGSVTTQVQPGVFMGAEARYLRRYDGLGLAPLAGRLCFSARRCSSGFQKPWRSLGLGASRSPGTRSMFRDRSTSRTSRAIRRRSAWNTISRDSLGRAARGPARPDRAVLTILRTLETKLRFVNG